MLPAELEDYWSRSRNRSMATAIYLSMKLFGISYFIATLYYDTNPHVTRVFMVQVLHTRPEATSSIIEIGYVAAVKTIIILRLRAIYGYDRKVSILLYALIAIEMAVAIVAVVGILLFATIFPVQIPFLLPGCWWWAAPSWWAHLRDKVMLALWMIRVLATSIEAILMLIKLADALNTERRFSEKSLLSAIGVKNLPYHCEAAQDPAEQFEENEREDYEARAATENRFRSLNPLLEDILRKRGLYGDVSAHVTIANRNQSNNVQLSRFLRRLLGPLTMRTRKSLQSAVIKHIAPIRTALADSYLPVHDFRNKRLSLTMKNASWGKATTDQIQDLTRRHIANAWNAGGTKEPPHTLDDLPRE
ncbi:hypothetical protein NP233_g11173 [Leucocoprinus birnbaumii]|uniref:Uncharacterized protein n=1 Tax=Leucocoprinus birnbaumii TaxID=56174 RepID=A0AAD5YKN3_9AGAR|nr:hypothetical protein NP233_g11173 [Leucocoprinus birnbaumii]